MQNMKYLTASEMTERFSVPPGTLKQWRIGCNGVKPVLIEGIHWFRPGRRSVLFNATLVEDWLANRHNPEAHQKAIEAYRASLPSHQL